MTVVRPNSIAGINSITVQTGQALNIHDASGNLIRNITSSSGVSTFSSLHVGAGTTTSTQGISVGTGCSIVSTTVNQLELYTNSSERLKITSSGLITQSNTWTNTYSASDTTHCGYQVHNKSDTTNTYAALRLTAGSSSPATAQIASVRTGTGSNDITFQVEASNTAKEALRIKSTGDVLIGGLLSDRGPALTVETNTYDGIGVYRNSADASTSLFTLAKSRGTSAGAVTVVNSGDKVGRIRFQGADGDELSDAAYIDCDIDATPGNNDMPGRLIFATSADGSASPTSRVEVNKDGLLYLNTNNQIIADADTRWKVQTGRTAISHNGTRTFTITGMAYGFARLTFGFYGEGCWINYCIQIGGYNSSNAGTQLYSATEIVDQNGHYHGGSTADVTVTQNNASCVIVANHTAPTGNTGGQNGAYVFESAAWAGHVTLTVS